jgi:prepilin-type N-terminal cleavage/methylation domain-containing protein
MLLNLKTTLARRRRHEGTGDEGFTLIDLMVVVGIIAVLLAIAIPTFLASRGKAQDGSAQFKAAGTASAGPTQVSVNGGSATSSTFCATSLSSSNKCYMIRDVTSEVSVVIVIV